MDETIFKQENVHLQDCLTKLIRARQLLELSLNEIGAVNLTRLKELRENPEKDPMDLFMFVEQLQSQNVAFNIKDKFQRLQEILFLLGEPYFSRIDLYNQKDNTTAEVYIGKFGYTEDIPIIIDWRARIASIYYRYRYPQKGVIYETPVGSETRDLLLKRTYEIDGGVLLKYYNNDIQLDESEIISERINKRTGGVLEDIVATIQSSQLDIIESDPRQICIVQGCVGSGKSTVAIHKLSHIFFNFPKLINPARSLLVVKSQILAGYLSTLFPKLGIFDINYKTIRELVYNLVFREEFSIKIDFDLPYNSSSFGLDDINNIRNIIKALHDNYAKQLTELLNTEENVSFNSFIYSDTQTIAENLIEVKRDLTEELEMQKEHLKLNPDSLRAPLAKENITKLRKLLNNITKMLHELRNKDFPEVITQLKLPIQNKLSYLDTLVYIFIYSELVGLSKTQAFDYCIVDEGQDFSALEYLILGKLVVRGRMCILGDLNQNYQGGAIKTWDDVSSVIKEAKQACVFELDTNYRSTQPIINLANTILEPYTQKFLPKSIHRNGPEPKLIKCSNPEDCLKEFAIAIKEDLLNLTKSIGVICYNESYFIGATKIIGNLALSPEKLIILNEQNRINYTPKGIYVMKQADCKGLEFAKVYILGLDLSDIHSVEDARRAYVSVTRAMNQLVVYFTN